ncbi:hypothetical protein KJ973_00525, partial [Patescibacteria group bacterium]|nr:hypothetical protein [Patescibacteria group bacterium]
KRGVGKMNFCSLASPPKADNGVGAFPQFLSLEEGKTEKFFSLIEKNLEGRRLKKCRENFSVLLAEVRAEGEGEAEHSSNSLWRRVRDSNS